MATRNGTIKKTDLMAFSRPRVGGIIALSLAGEDELIAARITDGTQNVFLCSNKGKSLRFLESDVRPSGRMARGVRGLKMESGDRIIGMEAMRHGQTLLAVTEYGYGKQTAIDEYPIHRRGGKGVITIKTTQRNGMVVAILLVQKKEDLMIITNRGKIIRIPVNCISVISRNTQGVKLIGLEKDEIVVGAANLPEQESSGQESDGEFESTSDL
jgi:DNA gyrase subunit A